ncbi:hypothetical protein FRC06_004813 [Ceratobasidium sp. 370]|nr:hypothetical protein FRC06_004813 [Ceratobasidium sp. 370]
MFPESPRWLVMKGRHDDALKTLARLHANGNTEDIFVKTGTLCTFAPSLTLRPSYLELEDIINGVEKERAESENAWSLLFFEPSNFRRLVLGVILQFSVQMTGVSAIQYYAPAIFKEVGFGAGQTLLFQSINSVIALIGEAACVLLVDRLGRRWPLISANIVSSSTFVIGTCIIAIYPADANNPNGNKSAHYAFVIMTWIFNFAFSAAIGPISWAYPVEIFGSATRARATAITSMAAWIANFMIAQVTPIAFNHIHWRYYLVFAICGYTNAVTVWALFPETKGRKLEEMDDLFKHTSWFVPTQNYAILSATQRENELRAGNAFGGEDAGDSSYVADTDEKDRVVNTEHKERCGAGAVHVGAGHAESVRLMAMHKGAEPGISRLSERRLSPSTLALQTPLHSMPYTPFSHGTKQRVYAYPVDTALVMDSKNKRTLHSERQRALHPGDRRKGKGGRSKPQRDPREHYGVTDVDFAVSHIDYDEQDYSVLPESEQADCSDVGAAQPRPGPEVSLAEIIKPARKRKGVAGDFEMVSRPGQVLALPIHEGFEDEYDDLHAGWEDVSEGGLRDSGRGAASNARSASYAAALSTHR